MNLSLDALTQDQFNHYRRISAQRDQAKHELTTLPDVTLAATLGMALFGSSYHWTASAALGAVTAYVFLEHYLQTRTTLQRLDQQLDSLVR
ncbi:MAG TPA: hypothetical protein VJH37_02230 [Candidatus Nanoarchaeia archaeon]|nr:hypothetical protein [Candidatus Nanoarchaeia archaeon]